MTTTDPTGLTPAETRRLANFLEFYNRGAESVSGLVDEVAGIRAAARAEALREAADALDDHTDCDCEDGDHLRRLATPTWLRNRAAREAR